MKIKLTCILLLGIIGQCYANDWSTGTFSNTDTWQACFTGQEIAKENCTQLAVNAINAAQTSIDVQAYSFTSAPILKALAAAQGRGVMVTVLLDKSDVSSRYSVTSFLTEHHIPFLIDYKPAIAHNKVMIIDSKTLITGSFNFTKAAQNKNAENLLLITDPELANQYLQNFEYRKSQSVSLSDYQSINRESTHSSEFN